MKEISEEAKVRFFEEAGICLKRGGFQIGPVEERHMPVFWQEAPLCRVSGTIDTIPEIPGLAVWCEGHIGVYIGGGEVIEAMGTRYGVVRTILAERNFTHWLQVPGISYD